jgi:cytidylate kinase
VDNDANVRNPCSPTVTAFLSPGQYEEATVPITTIVAISRQFGSGGAYVGRLVAQRLGLRYADREILAEAARALNVETDDAAPLEERVPGFWERLAVIFAQGAVTPFTPPPLPTLSESALFSAEREIIATIAGHGGAVIVGRGAAHILSGRPDVFRVFLHAPLPMRIALAAEEYGFTDRDAAARVVRASDAQRARFVRSLTGRDWCDAALYDLSLNTETTGLERAVDLIINLIHQRPALAPRFSPGPRMPEIRNPAP